MDETMINRMVKDEDYKMDIGLMLYKARKPIDEEEDIN